MTNNVHIGSVRTSIACTEYFTVADGAYGHVVVDGNARGLYPAVSTDKGVDDVMRSPLTYTFTVFCVLTLHGGYTVVGRSERIDAKAFDVAVGRPRAHADAIDKVCALHAELRAARTIIDGDLCHCARH